MENNKDYNHTGFGTEIPDYYKGINYSPSAGLQRTNCISKTSHTYDQGSMVFDSWMLPITTFENNKNQTDSKYKSMEALQKPRLLLKS